MIHVAALSIYPVKSMRGHAVASAPVEPWGLSGDRRLLVVDERDRFLTQREVPRMATIAARLGGGELVLSQSDGRMFRCALPRAEGTSTEVFVWRDSVAAHHVDSAADAWLSSALGRACRIVYMASPEQARAVDPDFAHPDDRVSFADGFPLLLTSVASLEDLNRRLAEPVPMDRFRPNLVLTGAPAWEEDGWTRLVIGSVTLDVVKPCSRCIITTVDQESGERHAAEPIATLKTFRRDQRGQVLFGQNLIPRALGTIAVGDIATVFP